MSCTNNFGLALAFLKLLDSSNCIYVLIQSTLTGAVRFLCVAGSGSLSRPTTFQDRLIYNDISCFINFRAKMCLHQHCFSHTEEVILRSLLPPKNIYTVPIWHIMVWREPSVSAYLPVCRDSMQYLKTSYSCHSETWLIASRRSIRMPIFGSWPWLSRSHSISGVQLKMFRAVKLKLGTDTCVESSQMPIHLGVTECKKVKNHFW